MKFTNSVALLATAVAGVSAEAITMMALRSASPIHFQDLHAYQEGIWIGEPTQSYCPEQVAGCQTVNATSFTVGASGASMVGFPPLNLLFFLVWNYAAQLI